MVSVIIPYNRDRGYLSEAIDSFAVAGEWSRAHGIDAELIMSGVETYSLAENFNECLDQVKTKYVCFLSEDDRFPITSIESRVKFMEKHPEFDLICANAWLFQDFDIDYKSKIPANYQALARHNTIHGGTVMYRTECVEVVNGMDESLITGEEWDMNIRILKSGANLGYLDAVVYFNRIWDGQKSGGGINTPNRFKNIQERLKYLKRITEKYT